MITGINESKTLTKHISCECKCKFDGRICKSDQWWNIKRCWRECKKGHVCKNKNVSDSVTFTWKNGKYLASIMDNSVIMGNEVTDSYNEEAKTIPTNFSGKKEICLITIALLIAVSIYYYLIKYQAKQKHLLPFPDTNNELKNVLY